MFDADDRPADEQTQFVDLGKYVPHDCKVPTQLLRHIAKPANHMKFLI